MKLTPGDFTNILRVQIGLLILLALLKANTGPAFAHVKMLKPPGWASTGGNASVVRGLVPSINGSAVGIYESNEFHTVVFRVSSGANGQLKYVQVPHEELRDAVGLTPLPDGGALALVPFYPREYMSTTKIIRISRDLKRIEAVANNTDARVLEYDPVSLDQYFIDGSNTLHCCSMSKSRIVANDVGGFNAFGGAFSAFTSKGLVTRPNNGRSIVRSLPSRFYQMYKMSQAGSDSLASYITYEANDVSSAPLGVQGLIRAKYDGTPLEFTPTLNRNIFDSRVDESTVGLIFSDLACKSSAILRRATLQRLRAFLTVSPCNTNYALVDRVVISNSSSLWAIADQDTIIQYDLEKATFGKSLDLKWKTLPTTL